MQVSSESKVDGRREQTYVYHSTLYYTVLSDSPLRTMLCVVKKRKKCPSSTMQMIKNIREGDKLEVEKLSKVKCYHNKGLTKNCFRFLSQGCEKSDAVIRIFKKTFFTFILLCQLPGQWESWDTRLFFTRLHYYF